MQPFVVVMFNHTTQKTNKTTQTKIVSEKITDKKFCDLAALNLEESFKKLAHSNRDSSSF